MWFDVEERYKTIEGREGHRQHELWFDVEERYKTTSTPLYQTAVVVTENKSPRGERATEEAIANGFLMENGEKWSEKGSQKRSDLTISDEKQTKKQPILSISDKKPSKKPSDLTENGHKNGHE